MNYVDPIYADYLDGFDAIVADVTGIDRLYPKPVVPKPVPVPTPEEELARLWVLVVQSAKN